MTEKIGRAADAVAAVGTQIVARNPVTGPASIQGAEDGAAALPGLFAEIDAGGDADAIVIACFDDTGLYEARRRTRVPVIGIGEAAYHMAMLVAARFSVVAAPAVAIPVIQENIMRYGLAPAAARCGPQRAGAGTGARGFDGTRDDLDEIASALLHDGSDHRPGCAGMADLAADPRGGIGCR